MGVVIPQLCVRARVLGNWLTRKRAEGSGAPRRGTAFACGHTKVIIVIHRVAARRARGFTHLNGTCTRLTVLL